MDALRHEVADLRLQVRALKRALREASSNDSLMGGEDAT